MGYSRVIPRDLFNEANLLKCYGQIYLNLERMRVDAKLVEDGDTDEGFKVRQNMDGAITLDNVVLMVRGELCYMWRPLNSRANFPLWLYPWGCEGDGDEIAVFNEDGTFSTDMVAFLQGDADAPNDAAPMSPIHHEAVTPDETDEQTGWDVIEDDDGFNVYDRAAGLVIATKPDLKTAVDFAYDLERQWLEKHGKPIA